MIDRVMAWVLSLGLCGIAHAGGIEIDVPNNAAKRGSKTTLTIQRDGHPLVGAKVTVTYNPKSDMQKDMDLGETDADGQVAWLPIETGIVQITVNEGQATRNTVVLFENFPFKGLAIFLFAGAFLYGGIVLAFLRMRKEWNVIGHIEEEGQPEEAKEDPGAAPE